MIDHALSSRISKGIRQITLKVKPVLDKNNAARLDLDADPAALTCRTAFKALIPYGKQVRVSASRL